MPLDLLSLPKVPPIDRLAKVGIMATLPNAKRSQPPVVDVGNRNLSPADQERVKNWFDGWVEREKVKKELESRDANLMALERRMGLSPVTGFMTGKPKSQFDELKAGFNEGLTGIGKLVAGLESMAGLPEAEDRRRMYDERMNIIRDYRLRGRPDSGDGLSYGDVANAGIALVPDLYNPLSKPGMVSKAGNALWHFARGYAPDKSIQNGVISSGSNLIGEKAEELITRGRGFVGNIVGQGIERLANYAKDKNKK